MKRIVGGIGLLSVFVMCMGIVNAVPYSKYGRSCKDIGCRTNELCVMETDPCTISSRGNCGSYPTCKRSEDSTGLSCTTKICPPGQYCKTVNGNSICVNTSPDLEFESAGVSSVNGHRIDGDINQNQNGVSHTNVNPYSNANAPPLDHHDTGSNIHTSNTNFGLGYPPDPNHSGIYPPNSGIYNNGQGVDKYGYPTRNRMPQQPGLNQPGGYPPYNSNYPLHPTNQLPGNTYQYPNNRYNNRNHSTTIGFNMITLGLTIFAVHLIKKYLS